MTAAPTIYQHLRETLNNVPNIPDNLPTPGREKFPTKTRQFPGFRDSDSFKIAPKIPHTLNNPSSLLHRHRCLVIVKISTQSLSTLSSNHAHALRSQKRNGRQKEHAMRSSGAHNGLAILTRAPLPRNTTGHRKNNARDIAHRCSGTLSPNVPSYWRRHSSRNAATDVSFEAAISNS